MTTMDEQCRLPNPSDQKLLSKLNKKYGVAPSTAGTAVLTGNLKYIRLEETDFTDKLFRVSHYGGEVAYSIAGFLEKHYDEVPEAVESMLQCSSNVILSATAAVAASSAITTTTTTAGSSTTTTGSGSNTNNSRTTAASAYIATVRNYNTHATTPTGASAIPNSPFRRAQNVNLGNLYRIQLTQLIEAISLTVPHFIRCIRASDKTPTHKHTGI